MCPGLRKPAQRGTQQSAETYLYYRKRRYVSADCCVPPSSCFRSPGHIMCSRVTFTFQNFNMLKSLVIRLRMQKLNRSGISIMARSCKMFPKCQSRIINVLWKPNFELSPSFTHVNSGTFRAFKSIDSKSFIPRYGVFEAFTKVKFHRMKIIIGRFKTTLFQNVV